MVSCSLIHLAHWFGKMFKLWSDLALCLRCPDLYLCNMILQYQKLTHISITFPWEKKTKNTLKRLYYYICVNVFTCCTGGAAGSISRNLPAIHVCQTNIRVQTHIKVITTERQKQRQAGTFLKPDILYKSNNYYACQEKSKGNDVILKIRETTRRAGKLRQSLEQDWSSWVTMK